MSTSTPIRLVPRIACTMFMGKQMPACTLTMALRPWRCAGMVCASKRTMAKALLMDFPDLVASRLGITLRQGPYRGILSIVSDYVSADLL